MKRQILSALCATAAVLGVATPAHALNIILTDTTGSFAAAGAKGQAALLAFRKAANFWNQTITSTATINIEIGFANLGANVLGSTGSSSTGANVTDVYSRLRAVGNSSLDATATANLFPLNSNGSLKFTTNAARFTSGAGALTNTTFVDNNNSTNNRVLDVNTANAKVLGLAIDNTNRCSTTLASADGCINFSNTFNFDFDPTNGLSAGAFDFVSVATHELGHALGFVSGVDTYDFVAANQTGDNLNNFRIFSVLDLFRYGTTIDAATGRRLLQLSSNRAARFSIDGVNTFNTGQTSVTAATFSTGADSGDGQQASHFKDVGAGVRQIGLLDPTIGANQLGIVTSNDLAVFDAIGYNINQNILNNRGFTFNSAQIFGLAGLAGLGFSSGARLEGFSGGLNVEGVPEPTTWLLMLIGFGFTGAAVRRRRTSVQITYA
jgi:PEP-CTERM motif